jgi:glycosyltransferase involved in cell wall biosynthesis
MTMTPESLELSYNQFLTEPIKQFDLTLKKYKISFCTVCMNRTEHLKLTLPRNIRENLHYGNLEFLVLDYNSTDGLEEWIETEMKEYIDKGILHYYKTTEPEYFHRSHSRNMIMQKATGDIICNVDADNYLEKFFASYINQHFHQNPYIIMGLHVTKQAHHSQAHGRICAWREDFIKVTGYDESMENYGYEDVDLCNRLELLGRKKVAIDELFLNYIRHGNKERNSNEPLLRRLDKFLIWYIDKNKTEVLMLNKDFNFEIINIKMPTKPSFFHTIAALDDSSSSTGQWSNEGQDIVLKHANGKTEKLIFQNLQDEVSYSAEIPSKINLPFFSSEKKSKKFVHITHEIFVENFILGLSKIMNLHKLKKNAHSKAIAVNKNPIGQGEVHKNFEHRKRMTA